MHECHLPPHAGRAVEPDTQEAVIVSFDVPEHLRDVFGFIQGQYLTLRKTIDGKDLRRSYSICAGVDDDELRVGVRKVREASFPTGSTSTSGPATRSRSWRRRGASSCHWSRRCVVIMSALRAAVASPPSSPS
jgi:hypothetical protein